MAIKIYEEFAPFANVGDTNYPNGSIKDDSTPGAEDGTPLLAVWGNDYAGFDAALFADTGIVPSGDPDTVLSSQRLSAIKLIPINDLSQAYEFPTVAAYKAFTTAFPVGKVIKLLDRGAEFTVIAGTGTANTFNIIASDQVAQSINLTDVSNATAFGLLFDDSTDNATAIDLFISTGKSYFEWDEGICRTSALIPIVDGTEHYFKNTTLRTTGVGVALLRANQTKDWAITGNLKLQGSGDGSALSTATSEILLNIVGARRYTIENVECIETTGVGFKSVADGLLVERAEAGSIFNLKSFRCQTGADIGAGTTNEFVSIASVNLAGNFYGLKTSAGNVSISTGAIVDNVAGITMGFGTNSNHGIISGVSINHNSAWNLQATDVVNGMLFADCNWYGDGGDIGRIELINSQGIVLNGGVLSAKVINNAGTGEQTGRNKLIGMTIPDSSRAVLAGDDLARLDSINPTPLNDTVDITGLILNNGWIDATYANTWATEAGRFNVGYYKDPVTALVHLRGICGLGTGTIFTLPAGYRPQATQEFAVNSNSAYGSILIQTDGQVIFINGDTAKVSLDGVSLSTSTV